jgi:hypothetical protein
LIRKGFHVVVVQLLVEIEVEGGREFRSGDREVQIEIEIGMENL